MCGKGSVVPPELVPHILQFFRDGRPIRSLLPGLPKPAAPIISLKGEPLTKEMLEDAAKLVMESGFVCPP